MSEEITSPLSGNIIKINIEVGESIEEDDEVMVIEAMKMETPIFSTADGTVKEIKVKEGDEVEEEQTLAIIE